MPIKKPYVDPLTYMALIVHTCRKSPEEIAKEAGFDDPDIILKICRGDAKLPLDKAAAIARACGKEPAFFLGLALATTQPDVWSILQATPEALLPYNEREFLKLYRRAAPRGKLEITPRRAAAVLEALNDGVGGAN